MEERNGTERATQEQFLCFMAVRLVSMHRILRDDGCLYLHCNTTAGAYLKTLMDAVFGREGFRNCITWRRSIAHNDAGQWGRITDSILFYTKGRRWTWNPVLETLDEAEIAKAFPKKDSRPTSSIKSYRKRQFVLQ